MTWRQTTVVVWVILAAGLACCQITALASNARLPRADALFRRLTARAVGRWLLVLGWMWLGWHAFAR